MGSCDISMDCKYANVLSLLRGPASRGLVHGTDSVLLKSSDIPTVTKAEHVSKVGYGF